MREGCWGGGVAAAYRNSTCCAYNMGAAKFEPAGLFKPLRRKVLGFSLLFKTHYYSSVMMYSNGLNQTAASRELLMLFIAIL